jgi:hypothetical protein
MDYVSLGCNRVANGLDWGTNGLIAFGGSSVVAIYDPEVRTETDVDVAAMSFGLACGSRCVSRMRETSEVRHEPIATTRLSTFVEACHVVDIAMSVTRRPK